MLAVRFEHSLHFYNRPSINNANIARPRISALKLSTNVITTERLGFCGGTEQLIICGLALPLEEQITVFTAPDNSKIIEIVYMQSTNEVCVLLDDDRIQVFDIQGLGVIRQFNLPELADSELRSMKHTEGKVFFGTDRGLLYQNIETGKTEYVETGKYTAVTDFFLMPHGIWILSENGMAYLAASRGESWQGPNAAQSLEVLGFVENEDNGVFIATYDGIFYWDRISGTHVESWSATSDESIDSRVTSLGLKDGYLFVGTFTAGFRIFEVASNGKLVSTVGHHLKDSGITTIRPTKDGLLIGTDHQGLKYFSNNSVVDIPMPLEWQKDRSPVTSITTLHQVDRFLVTTEDQLVLVCTDRSQPYACSAQSARTGALKPRIISSTSDSDGSIWLGTLNHGLLESSVTELEGGATLRRSSLNSTDNLSIYSVILETSGNLWAATNNGLLVIDTRSGDARRLGRIHGLANIDFNHGASLKAGQDLYFGGHFGYDKVRLASTSKADNPTPIWIRGFAVGGVFYRRNEQLVSSSELTIAPDQGTIDFHLTVNDYRLPLLHQYQHKLEGFDNNWQNTGNVNVATYQNLPPGNYTFRARGANSTGVWSDNEINLPIQVLPPLWRSWWALLSYLVLALGIFMYLKRLNDHYVAHNERLKLAEEGSAAFARLEDDYQAQREANEALLLRRAPSAKALLDAVETALTAQLADTDTNQAASALVNKLRTLRSLQTLTDRTTREEHTDLHAVTNEIAARLAASNEVATQAIISNDVCSDPITLDHALYVCLVIQETLELATTGRRFESLIDPLIYISMATPVLTENGEYSYELLIEDSGLKDDDSDALERLLPLTFHLIESGGGELSEDYDAGNILTIKLLFPASSAL
ncbi:MAG: hypothetical protein ACI9KD_003163 [Congregibacter sp.]